MRNLLIHEFDAEMSKVAARYGADGGSAVANQTATWTTPLSSMNASIFLNCSPDRYMVVECRATASVGGMGTDCAVMLRDAAATLDRALSAFLVLKNYRVWLADAPCDMCSGRGGSHGKKDCRLCGGAGVRNSQEVA